MMLGGAEVVLMWCKVMSGGAGCCQEVLDDADLVLRWCLLDGAQLWELLGAWWCCVVRCCLFGAGWCLVMLCDAEWCWAFLSGAEVGLRRCWVVLGCDEVMVGDNAE